jgi:adenylosuccinate synthase
MLKHLSKICSRASGLHKLKKHASFSSVPGTVSGTVSGLESRVCAVLGGQWGDEGKGKLADVLAKNYDVVCRFNGGANAGHTVIADGVKYAFHLLPCGLIYPHTMNLLGNGTVVHLPGLFEETAPLDENGIEWQGRLFISNRATMLFDFHQIIDGINEERLAGADGKGETIGTTRKGIGPAYTAKMARLGLRFGDLAGDWSAFEANFRKSVVAHQQLYDFEYDIQAELDRYAEYKIQTQDMIVDGVQYVNEAYNSGKNIISEGANAAMLDIDFGTYPFVTSSTTTSGGIATGLGLAPTKIDSVIGVVKAYTTRVGWG